MASNREESDSSTDSTYVPDDDIPARRALFREEEAEIDAIQPEIDSSDCSEDPLFKIILYLKLYSIQIYTVY